MKSIYTLYFSCLVLLISIFSCEFESNEVYLNPINKDVAAPNIEVVQLNIDDNNDTIFLYTDKEIEFNFSSNPHAIHGVELIINDESKQAIQDSKGNFENVSWYSLNEGLHSLKINIYTSSGTGSLADQLGAESYIMTKEWVLKVDKSYSKQTKETTKDGVFSMQWPDCKSYDFKEYVITKYFDNTSIELSRQTTTSFEDDSYVGENCSYIIKALTSNNEFQWGGLQMEKQIPKFTFEADKNNQYSLKFTKPKYYSGIESIVIAEESSTYGEWNTLHTYAGGNDTIYQITNASFGNDKGYRLFVKAKGTNPSYAPNSWYFFTGINVEFGYEIDPEDYRVFDVHQVSADEFIYNSKDAIKRYSTSSQSVVEKIEMPLIEGCYGRRLGNIEYSTTGKTMTVDIGCSMDIAHTSTRHLSSNDVRSLEKLTGSRYSPSVPISDVGIGVVETSESPDFYMYDFNTSKIIGRTYYHAYDIRINSTAEYLYIHGGDNIIAHFKDGYFTTKVVLDAFDSDYKHFEFNGLIPEQCVVWYGDELLFKDCETYTTIRSFSLNGEQLYDIDYYNGKVLTWKSRKLTVRDINDGTVLEEIPVSFTPNIPRSNCKIINNCIVYEDEGLIYFLKQ